MANAITNISGDHIRQRVGIYYHHMIVVSVLNSREIRVIHYTQRQGENKLASIELSYCKSSGQSPGKITEETIEIDLNTMTIEVVKYAEGEAIYTGWAVVVHARKRIDEESYNLFFNNCESFANWAVTEKNRSDQGRKGLAAGVGLTVGVVGAIAVGIGMAAVAIGKGKNRNSD